MEKLQPPLKNVNPFFPATPLEKLRPYQDLPFWKFSWGFNPTLHPSESEGWPYNYIINNLEM